MYKVVLYLFDKITFKKSASLTNILQKMYAGADMSHQSEWIYCKQPIKFLIFIASK